MRMCASTSMVGSGDEGSGEEGGEVKRDALWVA